jgi:hypothetical protein
MSTSQGVIVDDRHVQIISLEGLGLTLNGLQCRNNDILTYSPGNWAQNPALGVNAEYNVTTSLPRAQGANVIFSFNGQYNILLLLVWNAKAHQ